LFLNSYQIGNSVFQSITLRLNQKSINRFIKPCPITYERANYHPSDYSYHACLAGLRLQTLADRRRFFDIDLVLRAFTGGINASSFISFFKFPPNSRNLRYQNPFLISCSNNSCINWCMRVCNDIKIDLTFLRESSYSTASLTKLVYMLRASTNPEWLSCI
jgi:hypothetical protein